MTSVLDLADLAAEQWGLVTTAQARSVGVSPQSVARLTNNGALERMTHGVYRVTGAPAAPLDTLRAAWLTLDPARRAGERLRDLAPAVVSHRSAASIHRLGDLEADQFEFTISERKQTRRADIRIHRGQVDTGEWTVVDGLPVTTVTRTIDDLASDRIDGGHLAGVVRDALTLQQVDDREIIATLRRHAHHYGAPLGDGETLLARLLQESGISQPLERAVALAATGQQITPRQLADQLAAIQRTMEPALRLSQQIADSPGMKVAAQAAELVRGVTDSPAMLAVAQAAEQMRAYTDSPAMRAFADAARQHQAILDSPSMRAMAEMARSPAVQQLAKEHAEVAEISRLARRATEGVNAINRPDIVIGDVEVEEG